jgi:hypothetical protein
VKDGDFGIIPDLEERDLFTKEEYGNFIFRFEFQLTPSANNVLASGHL